MSVGTAKTGFVTDQENRPPRECHNCKWYKNDTCGQSDVMQDSEAIQKALDVLGKIPSDDGRVPVGDLWCCNFFENQEEDTNPRLLYLVMRHGCTTANEEGVFRGQGDYPLDEQGMFDAVLAAYFLYKFKINQIICSPLDRAVTTALIANEYVNSPIVKDSRLMPWDVGYFTGKDKEDYKDELDYYINNPEEDIPDGESLEDFQERVYNALDSYQGDVDETGILNLYVMHNSTIVTLNNKLRGLPTNQSARDDLQIAPGGILGVYESVDGDTIIRSLFGESQSGDYQSS